MKKKFKLITKNLFSNKNKNTEQDCNEKLSFEYNSFKYYKKFQINNKVNFSYNPNKNNIKSFQIINLKIKKRNLFQIFYFILFSLINCILAEKVFNYRKLNNDNIIKLNIKNEGFQKVVGSKILPDEVYLNGKLTNINTSGYITINKNNNGNEITLVWKKKLDSCENLFDSCVNITEIDLSNFDTSGVTSMVSMFFDCRKLKYINFENINTSSVTNMSMMFQNCQELTELDLSMFQTPKLKSMDYMFTNANSIYLLDITSFDTSQVISIKYMFFGMQSLMYIDLSKLNTSKVTNMDLLFGNCQSLIALDLSPLNTSKIQTMYGMFAFCNFLEEINFTNFDTSSVTNMMYMFIQCSSLSSLDLSNFNTSKVQNMYYMFSYCSRLNYINLTNIDITNVYYMDHMFAFCTSLTSLDLSSFIFQQADARYLFYEDKFLIEIKFSKKYKIVEYAEHMFDGCSSLKSIDLYNFDFGIVESLRYLFYGCSSLVSVDLSYIDTFQVSNMEYMFYGCNSLVTLNFSNWITSSVTTLTSMFYDCSSLISLDLSNFDTSLVVNMKDLFFNCLSLTSINLKSFDTSKVTDMQSMFYGCNSLLSLDLSNFDTSRVVNMQTMFYNCFKLTSLNLSNFNTKNIENMDSMFSGCKNLGYINFYNFREDSLQSLKNIFSEVPDNLNFCMDNSTEESKTQILEEFYGLKCAINDCSNEWNLKKPRIIYYSGECIESCLNDEDNKYEYKHFCYNKCPKGTHSLKNSKFFCQELPTKCIKKYPFITVKDNSCLGHCDSYDFFNNICTLNERNPYSKEMIIYNIENDIKDGLMNILLEQVIKDEKKELIKKVDDTLYHITSSYNQNIKKYENISSIKLGECENILKEKYNIIKNETLIIFKIERDIEEMLIPLIEYEIFNPITKSKLDLNYCKNSNITIHIPVNINESILFKYDPNNSYYNDICYIYTNENGIYITIYDRKEEYNKKKLSLCPFNCIFYKYISDNKEVICQCKIQNGINSFSESNKDDLMNNLINDKSFLNLKVIKCFKLLFTKEEYLKNFGNHIILLIIFFYIVSVIYFFLKGYNKILEQIEELILAIKLENDNKINSKKDRDKEFLENSTSISSSKKSFNKNNPIYKLDSENKVNFEINSKDILNNKIKSRNGKLELEKYKSYNDYEMNIISFDEALEFDKRTFFQFYFSLIKLKHIISFLYNNKKDYNPYIIKLCLFFFMLAFLIFTNTLFFNDSTMHEIYINKKYSLSYFFPQIIYAIILYSIINDIIKVYSLSQKDILEIKHVQNKSNLNAKVVNVVKCLYTKFICFFIFSFIFLFLFWIYLSSFCAVYKKIQIYLFLNVLISFLLLLIFPFIACLFPCFFRIPSLRSSGQILYKISQIIQLI